MIYLGVKLFPNAFTIAALSETFAPLGQRYFKTDKYRSIELWLDTLKSESNELTKWFFDELEFGKVNYPGRLFELLDCCHQILLVNHRKLQDMAHFFYDWNATTLNYRTKKPNIAFLLASSLRIFDEFHIIPFQPDDEPF